MQNFINLIPYSDSQVIAGLPGARSEISGLNVYKISWQFLDICKIPGISGQPTGSPVIVSTEQNAKNNAASLLHEQW